MVKPDFYEADRWGESGKIWPVGLNGSTPGAGVVTWKSGSLWKWVARTVEITLQRYLTAFISKVNWAF